eukprot:s3477_g3.t1
MSFFYTVHHVHSWRWIWLEEKVAVEKDLAFRLQRIKEIESGMPQKVQQLQHLQQLEQQKEAEYMKMLEATPTLVQVMCAFEIPVFKYISKLWTERGYSLVAVLGFSELVMALRCFLYGIIPRNQPWLVLLVEPLHGFTFAAAWCATVTYASRIALPGTEAKMQALINGLNFNVAFALGSFAWGYASQNPPAGLGFTRCFFLDAALTAGWLAIWASGFAAARYISARRRRRR